MKRLFLSLGVALVALLSACAVKPPLAPPRDAPAAPTPEAVAPKTAPLPADDLAWARVVEMARKEGKVNVYTVAWTGDAGPAIAEAFGKKYDIKLSVVTGAGPEFIERMKTEARMGNVMADMLEGSPTHFENMKLAGLQARAGDLPVLRDKAPFAVSPLLFSPEGLYLFEGQSYVGLHVNTNLVKPGEEPKAWVDLLEPKWKGRIIGVDPLFGTLWYNFAILIEQNRLAADFPEKLGKQDLKFDHGGPGAAARLARGEASAGYFSTGASNRFAQEGAPIRIVDTREGVFVGGSSVGMMKGGPHPNATRLLFNWLLSQEGQNVYTRAKGVLTVRKDVPDYQHPAIQLNPQNPIFITAEHNEAIARLFREKQYVPLLKPK